jgi:hypothetical protein
LLITPCILAGCPARCCPVCGRGWRRVVSGNGPDKANSHQRAIPDGQTEQRGLAAAKMGSTWTKITLGFEPACTCGRADSVPGTVLDPFGGSGTTGDVARQHGRRAVLIDLNPDYQPLQAARIAAAGPLYDVMNG